MGRSFTPSRSVCAPKARRMPRTPRVSARLCPLPVPSPVPASFYSQGIFPPRFPRGAAAGPLLAAAAHPARGARVIPGLPHLPHTPGLSRCHSRAASVGGGSCWEGLVEVFFLLVI